MVGIGALVGADRRDDAAGAEEVRRIGIAADESVALEGRRATPVALSLVTPPM